jgi:prepilin peptidase CpaA
MMANDEWAALASLLGRLFFDGRIGALFLLLLVAAVYDARTRRIPNWLTVSGAIYGIAYVTAFPPVMHGTILFPLGGLIVGFLIFLPLYLVRAMGAGDVKLLAMAGAFLGPLDTLYCALASVVAGGALSILWAFAHGTGLRLFRNIASLLPFQLGVVVGAPVAVRMTPATSAGKLPYAIAIASGTLGYLTLHQLGLL